MEIILLERIDKLGALGQIVKVKDGYARNYLLPQKKALRATKDNKRRFEQERDALEKLNDEKRNTAQTDANKIENRQFVLIRQASDTLQLYGSVSAKDIAEAIIATGVDIRRQQIRLDRPIKSLGVFEVRIAVHPEVLIKVKINVARSEEEADLQAKGGSISAGEENDSVHEIDEINTDSVAEALFESPEKELEALADSNENSSSETISISDPQNKSNDRPGTPASESPAD